MRSSKSRKVFRTKVWVKYKGSESQLLPVISDYGQWYNSENRCHLTGGANSQSFLTRDSCIWGLQSRARSPGPKWGKIQGVKFPVVSDSGQSSNRGSNSQSFLTWDSCIWGHQSRARSPWPKWGNIQGVTFPVVSRTDMRLKDNPFCAWGPKISAHTEHPYTPPFYVNGFSFRVQNFKDKMLL
jgi:hypothetical protein